MKSVFRLGFAFSIILSATAQSRGSSDSSDPCAVVAEEQSSNADQGDEPVNVGVNATNLYNCLTSVPLVQEDALQYLEYARAYAQFHTGLPYLKDPPKSWQQPGVDLLARLDEIKKVSSGSYDNQYDFDAEVFLLARSTNDFHFNLKPGVLGSTMWAWSLQWSLTSFSADGKALPKVYVYEDIALEPTDWEPSAIVTLDGRSVGDYLAYVAMNYNLIGVSESHAEWNIMMRNAAFSFNSGSAIEQSLFTISSFYRGETLSVTFENGTESTWEWVGYSTVDMTRMNLTSAENIYNNVVLQQQSTTSTNEKRQDSQTEFIPYEPPTYIYQDPYYVPLVQPYLTQTSAPTASSTPTKVPSPNYPDPSIIQEPFGAKEGYVTGYIYEEESVAVISIPSFETETTTNQSSTFGKAISDTMIAAKKANIKKIVVDVSGNGGGVTFQGYDSFKRIFPDIYPYQLVRTIATETLDFIGNALDGVISDTSGVVDGQVQGAALNLAAGLVALSSTLKFTEANGTERFGTFQDYFGPVFTSNANFTNVARFDFGNLTLTEGMGIKNGIFGFEGNEVPSDYPRYQSSDIILLSDGFCGSTCSVFAELMKSAGGVLSVAVGGTPTEGPMQPVSGSRGANVYPWKAYDKVVEILRGAARQDPEAAAQIGLDNATLNAFPPALSELRYDPTSNRINALDILRPEDNKSPLQFAYEPADCRIFYTREMVNDQSLVWLAAANVSRGDFSACVKGSTNQKGAGTAVVIESPGFNNSFQAAVNGTWNGNDTWGASNTVGAPAPTATGSGDGKGKKNSATAGFQVSGWMAFLTLVAGGFFCLA